MDLIDYDGLIQQARDLIAYGRQFNRPEIVRAAEGLLSYWLERTEDAAR